MTRSYIKRLIPITLYDLKEYDGADGRSNTSSGFVTTNQKLSLSWKKQVNGRSTSVMSGLLVETMEDIANGKNDLIRQNALDKLTEKEKLLLGLLPDQPKTRGDV
jgi:hypothetical protein